MKASMRLVGHQFNTHRMVLEYAERYYLPGLEAQARLAADGHAAARALAGYVERVRRGWGRGPRRGSLFDVALDPEGR